MTTTNNVNMIDIRDPDHIEIVFSADGRTIWVNVDGICRLRAKGLTVADARKDLYDNPYGDRR